jgi:1,4-alpha-glucan branching enzyme
MNGHLQFVLHAHLPYIRHPEHPYHLEENWLFEAILETYLPLLEVFEGLERDRVPGRMTISMSQPLMAMLDDELLRDRFVRHAERLIELATREVARNAGDDAFEPLAHYYLERLDRLRRLYLRHERDLVGAFAALHARGRVELATCVGTHGFLPLMLLPSSRRGQILTAAEAFERRCGFATRGMWMGECAFTPGVERDLADAGVRFSFVDSHALEFASSRPLNGLFAPVVSPAGTAFFARDPESSAQVWSSHEGYPGDFNYREYYRDVGFDLPLDYIRPYIHPDGIRVNTGLKYHRITQRGSDHREPYQPDVAHATARSHARHFVECRHRQLAWAAQRCSVVPVVTCPYDAELFGHWWFEGPLFLDAVFRELAASDQVVATSPTDYLATNPVQQEALPSASSWGEAGYFSVWLNPGNAWIYPLLHRAEERVAAAVNARVEEPAWRPVLQQLVRELLLAQASDWAFIIKTGTTVGYAEARTRSHLDHIDRLCDRIEASDLEGAASLAAPWFEAMPLFSDVEPRHWRSP